MLAEISGQFNCLTLLIRHDFVRMNQPLGLVPSSSFSSALSNGISFVAIRDRLPGLGLKLPRHPWSWKYIRPVWLYFGAEYSSLGSGIPGLYWSIPLWVSDPMPLILHNLEVRGPSYGLFRKTARIMTGITSLTSIIHKASPLGLNVKYK